jgi:hypothetical protein
MGDRLLERRRGQGRKSLLKADASTFEGARRLSVGTAKGMAALSVLSFSPGYMRQRLLLVVVLVAPPLLAVSSVLGWTRVATAASPWRIIDRTLVCRMSGIGYPDAVRFMHVGANQYQPATDSSPSINVGNGTPAVPGASASVRTGSAGDGSQTTTGELALTRAATKQCATTRLRIPLSSRRLRAAPSDRFSTDYRCDVPARVLIRVRAVFKRPTVFSVNPRYPDVEAAKGGIINGYIAVATLQARKALVFASVNDASRKARLFVARSECFPR